MNSFGRVFRLSLYGESHGAGLGVLLDGVPPGLELCAADFVADLGRRRSGAAGTTARRERDQPALDAGVFEDRTTGAPLLVRFVNEDSDSAPYERLRHTPRPGHADLPLRTKQHGFNDYRGGGHSSGRITAGLVAAGVVAKKIIAPVTTQGRLLEVAGRTDIEAAVAEAVAANDSVGGLLECRAVGLPVGLGEPFFDSLESLLSHLAFAIGGVRGIEFGAGFASARMRGSECNDPILDVDGRTQTNHAGGINGGISNGNELVFRVAVKPTSSIRQAQRTVDLRTGEAATLTVEGRHDGCIALRMPVILEAITAIVLADLLLLQRALQPLP